MGEIVKRNAGKVNRSDKSKVLADARSLHKKSEVVARNSVFTLMPWFTWGTLLGFSSVGLWIAHIAGLTQGMDPNSGAGAYLTFASIFMSVSFLFCLSGIIVDANYSARRNYLSAINAAAAMNSDIVEARNEWFRGTEYYIDDDVSVLKEAKYRNCLNPLNLLGRPLTVMHGYNVETGIHEVVTIKNRVFALETKVEKYETDRAVFNRAIENLSATAPEKSRSIASNQASIESKKRKRFF